MFFNQLSLIKAGLSGEIESPPKTLIRITRQRLRTTDITKAYLTVLAPYLCQLLLLIAKAILKDGFH